MGNSQNNTKKANAVKANAKSKGQLPVAPFTPISQNELKCSTKEDGFYKTKIKRSSDGPNDVTYLYWNEDREYMVTKHMDLIVEHAKAAARIEFTGGCVIPTPTTIGYIIRRYAGLRYSDVLETKDVEWHIKKEGIKWKQYAHVEAYDNSGKVYSNPVYSIEDAIAIAEHFIEKHKEHLNPEEYGYRFYKNDENPYEEYLEVRNHPLSCYDEKGGWIIDERKEVAE